MKNEKFLTDILNQISVGGFPEKLQEVLQKEMASYADEIRTDAIGDTVCVLNPQAEKKILLAAHADEIGLMVTYIAEDGMLHVSRYGGIIPHTYPGQRVQIETANGVVYGVVQITRELMKKQDLSASDFLVDIGASCREEAEKLVEPGDGVVFDTCIRKLAGGRFTARALDDRLGVFIIMEALKRAKERGCSCGVYAGATVGEETTKNGARWTAERVKPDAAIVVDVTYTSDYAGVRDGDAGRVELGKGPVLCINPLIVKSMNAKMKTCAEKSDIAYQIETGSGMTCTDADQIHFANEGIPTVLVSIPLRYMHSPAEVADEKDVEGCIELITEFLLDASADL